MYIAVRRAYLGKAIDVIRDGVETHASLILVGDLFEYDGPMGKWLEVYEDKPVIEQAETVEDPRQQVIDQLKELDVPYFRGAKTEVLQALLETTKAKE